MTNLTKLTIFTAALMVLASAAAFFSGGGPFHGTATEEEAVSQAPVSSAADRRIADLQARSAARPNDPSSVIELGFAYLQKARESGDPAYYSKADAAFQQIESSSAPSKDVFIGRGAVALERHDFETALAFANQALALDAEDADAHAVAGDALIELGRYDEGVAAFQRVADLRPDMGAFVRIAYARELHGDIGGAQGALEMAIEAAGPRGEGAAFARLQLGHLLFGSGDLAGAETQYDRALDSFPGYVHALAGLARVHAARAEYGEAISLYELVVARQPVLEYVIALGDTYAADGKDTDAARQYALVAAIGELYAASGVNTDLESAVFLADRGERLDQAISQARAVYDSQPGSIRAADALAWTLHRSGRSAEALAYARQSLRLGTRDNNLLFHAAIVEQAAGDPARARALLQQIADTNPRFSLIYSDQAADALAELTSLAEAR